MAVEESSAPMLTEDPTGEVAVVAPEVEPGAETEPATPTEPAKPEPGAELAAARAQLAEAQAALAASQAALQTMTSERDVALASAAAASANMAPMQSALADMQRRLADYELGAALAEHGLPASAGTIVKMFFDRDMGGCGYPAPIGSWLTDALKRPELAILVQLRGTSDPRIGTQPVNGGSASHLTPFPSITPRY